MEYRLLETMFAIRYVIKYLPCILFKQFCV